MHHRFARLVATSLFLLPVACGDGVSPGQEADGVQILLDGRDYEEQTIRVDQSLQFSAEVRDADGDVVPNTPVDWRSTDPAIVTIGADGIASGVAVGTASIIASHQVGSDTAVVNVALPLTGAPNCAPADERALGIGETAVLEGAASAAICLPGGANGAGYHLSLVNVSSTAGARLDARIEATGVLGADGPTTQRIPSRVASTANEAFHMWMRDEVSDRLAGRLALGIDPSAFPLNTSAATVGDLIDFNVESTSGDGCSAESIRLKTARVRAEGRYAVVAADTLSPAGGFTESDYQGFARFFDESVWPLVTETFGAPSDIDSNGKVVLLFTTGVNERPENSGSSSGIFVGGFFFNRDLFPTSGNNSCAGSNKREMFYLLVPDPNGSISGRRFRTDFVRETTRSVLVHEFQHLVNDSRRLHVNRAPVWEETWLNEGLSHIAEELMFRQLAGIQTGTEVDAVSLRNEAVREAFGVFQLDNLERFAGYLRQPSSNSLMGVDNLATRGAAWHFLRYAANRTGNEGAFWKAMVTDASTSGLNNLQKAIGSDPKPWIRDWGAAVLLDDLVNTDAKYQIPTWDLRSLYPVLTNYWPEVYFGRYPLNIQTVAPLPAEVNVNMLGNGSAYGSATVAPGGRGAIRVSVGGLPAPSRLKVIVTRTS